MADETNTVLVVDDHPDLCAIMVRMLELCGRSATYALDGVEALEAIRRSPPGLVLLDIMMPGLGGFEVLKAVRDDPRFSSIPVVMCSAIGDPSTRREATELGAQDYMVKGHFGYDELKAMVEKYV
ncbi:MAG: two-component system sensor histidine kinase/response regulator [Phycisphaerales bacterium]|nr:two-component system sensor histidine kinase/response regulator [Phycisphaerales bacterium]